jgi:hypothetical protein
MIEKDHPNDQTKEEERDRTRDKELFDDFDHRMNNLTIQ